MTGSMDGRAGLVTGAAGGIGRATAVALAEEGASVAIADLESAREGGEETVGLVEAAGGKALFVPCDVTSPEDNDRLVAETVSAFGRLDFAHNNAGVFGVGSITDIDDAEFHRVMAINLNSVWYGVRAEVREMRSRGGGAIVNSASMAGLAGGPKTASYTTSKHAVIGLTRAAACDYADENIRVNAVCPGPTHTPLTSGLTEERLARILPKLMIHRMGEAAEIADAVVWLLSDRASFVTGAAIPVDGGATASL